MLRVSLLVSVALVFAGCSHAVQTTSGENYLRKHPGLTSKPVQTVASTYSTGSQTVTAEAPVVSARSVSELIHEAASVEPLLTFPARFGLARIENGILTTIPTDEAALWQEMAGRFDGFGSFTPVDPIIVEFTSKSLPPATHQIELHHEYDGNRARRGYTARDLPTKIRLGAARQHLDAVLIYEVGMGEKHRRKSLTAVNLTILGKMPLSDHTWEAAGAAKAILLDVRNAYPYGTAQIEKDLSGYAETWFSDSARRDRREKARKSIAATLVPGVEDMMRSLVTQLQAKQLRGS